MRLFGMVLLMNIVLRVVDVMLARLHKVRPCVSIENVKDVDKP